MRAPAIHQAGAGSSGHGAGAQSPRAVERGRRGRRLAPVVGNRGVRQASGRRTARRWQPSGRQLAVADRAMSAVRHGPRYRVREIARRPPRAPRRGAGRSRWEDHPTRRGRSPAGAGTSHRPAVGHLLELRAALAPAARDAPLTRCQVAASAGPAGDELPTGRRTSRGPTSRAGSGVGMSRGPLGRCDT